MSDFEAPSNAIRTRACILYIDRFLRGVFIEGADVTLQDARDCVSACRAMLGPGKSLPISVDLRRLRSQSAEARAYLAGPDGVVISPAVALIVGSPLSRAIGNFYLGFNRPPVPTRLFNDGMSADKWLEGFATPLERVA